MLTWENGSTIDRVGKDEQGWIFGGGQRGKDRVGDEMVSRSKGVRISKEIKAERKLLSNKRCK